ncbi:hypothetical protein T492DRAFT_431986 [Pavlovales sp. CCMP2436]|nr:hypothetical protein T492DRAFT_431986 [Pavlovales sp. CCMP2436]
MADHADGEEFDSWLTGRTPPGAPATEASSSWWPASVPSLPTSLPPLPTDSAQLGSMLWDAALMVRETVAGQIDDNLHEFQAERKRVLAEARRLQPAKDAEGNDAPPPWKVLSEQYQVRPHEMAIARAHRPGPTPAPHRPLHPPPDLLHSTTRG